MTREQLNKHWKEIEAFKNGAEIECKYGSNKWAIDPDPDWYSDFEYRAKPKAREWWITLDPNGQITVIDDHQPSWPVATGWTRVHVQEVK